MAANKVQLQAGLSMLEFFDRYGTQEKCEEAVRQWRWPQGFACPACGGVEYSQFRRVKRLYFQCSACRYQCSLISGTIFESSKLALAKWFVAMHLITQAKNGVSALELMRHVGVSWPTAWLMKHKLLQVMFEREESRQLTGRVEIDDAYLGGEHHGGKPGRGSPNKTPFVAAVQTTESGAPVLICLAVCPFTKDAIEAFAAKSLAAPATLVSDGLGCFTAVQGMGILHEPHVTGGGAASVQHPHPVHGRQHGAGQLEDRIRRHLPLVGLREVRSPLPCPGAVPIQSPLRPARHPHQPRSRRLRYGPTATAGAPRG